MLKRYAEDLLREKASYYPVVAITGPRQSGKSTLAKKLFTHKPYCSLEDWDMRQFAIQDPRGFLAQFPEGAVLDEVQHCPELFSYIQTLTDQKNKMGFFILTGSQQFGLMAKITQSLAGRVGFLQLLPFSLCELQLAHSEPNSLEEMIFKGFYPPIYDRNIPPQNWLSDYVMTYVERDIRQLLEVQNLRIFHRFIQMCATRTGQLLNLSSLANDCGITHNTAKKWISVLETSYILFLLPPHYRNFNKRLVKTPKLYFYDTGLACFLAGIQQSQQLTTHTMRGALFETWVVTEFIKHRFNQGLLSNLYFWQDSQGHEVDIIYEKGEHLVPIEIKSGQTISADYFQGLNYWNKLNKQNIPSNLIYGGEMNYERAGTNIFSWKNINQVFNHLADPLPL